jgi:hypothetical protein
VRGLAVAADGSFALSGLFFGTGLSIGDTNLEFLANRNFAGEAYVAKFDPSGNVQWVIQTHGLEPRTTPDPPPRYSDVRGAAIAMDPTGGVFLTGHLKGNVQFSDLVLYGPPADPISGSYWTVYAARLTDPSGEAVHLRMVRTDNVLHLRWPASLPGFVLEHSDHISNEAWEAVSATPIFEGNDFVVTVSTGSESKFFRLRKP